MLSVYIYIPSPPSSPGPKATGNYESKDPGLSTIIIKTKFKLNTIVYRLVYNKNCLEPHNEHNQIVLTAT